MTHARFTAFVLARRGRSDEGTLLCAGIDRRVITLAVARARRYDARVMNEQGQFSGELPVWGGHCSRCRKATGSAFGVWALVDQDSFNWTAGTEQIAEHASSDHGRRVYCKRCGATLGNPYPAHVFGSQALACAGAHRLLRERAAACSVKQRMWWRKRQTSSCALCSAPTGQCSQPHTQRRAPLGCM